MAYENISDFAVAIECSNGILYTYRYLLNYSKTFYNMSIDSET